MTKNGKGTTSGKNIKHKNKIKSQKVKNSGYMTMSGMKKGFVIINGVRVDVNVPPKMAKEQGLTK